MDLWMRSSTAFNRDSERLLIINLKSLKKNFNPDSNKFVSDSSSNYFQDKL